MSPLIADPFLSEKGCTVGNVTENVTEIMHHLRFSLRNIPMNMHNMTEDHELHVEEEESSVSYAFWIMAFINVRYFTITQYKKIIILTSDLAYNITQYTDNYTSLCVLSYPAPCTYCSTVSDVPGTANPLLSQWDPSATGQR